MEKKKILLYNSTLLRGGTESYIVSFAEFLDKEKFDTTLLIKDGNEVDEVNLKRFENAGVKVELVKGCFAKRILGLRKFFKTHKNEFDVAHINATSQGAGLLSYFSHKNGKIKKIIFHSHMGGNDNKKDIVDKIGDKMLKKHSTHFAACSKLAGEFMFGKEFADSHEITLLKNSINTQKFTFNEETRKKYRKEFGLDESSPAIIHIGRFSPQKNHKKLISVFAETLKLLPKSKLFLIGQGELEQEIKTQVQTLEIENNVVFMGLRDDIPNLMMMADLFLMPSVHEGLGIVLVEAQASNLPCIAASTIPEEAKINENYFSVALEKSDSEWAEIINKALNQKQERKSMEKALEHQGYKQQSAIKEIEKLYLD